MILNGGYKEQFQRVLRYLEKVKNQNRGTLEYSDDIWAFFQNCWHLKDWIKNDPGLPQKIRTSIEKEVKKYDSLMICADLTNRSKHLALEPGSIRKDAKITGIDVTVHAAPITIYLNREPDNSDIQETGYVEHPFYIETSDGKKMDGLSVAIQAVDDWKKILQKLSLTWT
jgi:hypothetical protein